MKADQRSRDETKASGLFDAEWYMNTYPDVRASGIDPLDHFLTLGYRLERNPGPKFDVSRYLEHYSDIRNSGYNPLLHYIRYAKKENRSRFPVEPVAPETLEMPFDFPIKRQSGGVNRVPGRPTVLLCAHVVGNELFGSERSLIDMLRGLRAMNLNVVMATPLTNNRRYIDFLAAQSCAVVQFPYGWWRHGTPINEDHVACFAQIINDERIDVVHVNTIMLREPLIAAQRLNVLSVVHVRELIHYDEKLLELIGEPAEDIVNWIWDNSDAVIANSYATAKGFNTDTHKTSVVYNTADMNELAALPLPVMDGPLRVGMVSSNLPKKGVFDFAEIARLVAEERSDVEFSLIGPINEHTKQIQEQIDQGKLPQSLKIAGYADTPTQAVASVDVVLSISNFQESFGRTVLESMAGGRVCIAHEYGAPPELIADGETGFVVPYRDLPGFAEKLTGLAADRRALLKMGLRARDRAEEVFGHQSYAEAMARAYEPLLEKVGKTKPKPMVLKARNLPARIPRDQLKVAYFCWHFPVPSETFVLNELRLLKEQGIDVTVFCKQSPYPDFQPDFDITWERVKDADHLAQRLQETGRTVVHGHFIYPTVTDMVWPAAEKAGIPFTCIAHAQDIFRYRNAEVNRIAEFSRSDNCQQIFTLSRFHRQFLIDRGVLPEKITINSNCIDPELFAGGKVEDRPKRATRKICAVSRFADKKGLEFLVEAGKHLEKDNVQINIYGYGPMEDLYRQILKEKNIKNVSIHGPVKGRDALMEVFRNHDLFACPSVRAPDGDMDGIPTTLMESMAAGLPVLTTPVAGIPDLVRDGVTGMMCTPTPEGIATRIREFYELPDIAIKAMIEDAEAQLRRNHHGAELVNTLVRFWANETIDLMIVAWNNLKQTREVIRRLYEYTSLPFHLIVCDNGSDAPALAHHLNVYAKHENFTLILNRENAYVGPGTNKCVEMGTSDYMIYVCGKEGMTTNYGWEKHFVRYMDTHPRVGQAGTLCYSPSYLFGRDYPKGVRVFDKFRNTEFAEKNPDRPFAHIQGGFFAMRRKTYDEIGGFSPDVFHDYTDVEYSYYVESCGWELGEVPGLMALFNKTRPGLGARVDEHHSAMHPPFLQDLPWLDAVARREVRRCNVCETQGRSFKGGDTVAICKRCGSTRRARSLHRVLAESILLYRRLPALGVNIPDSLAEFWKFQFQGPALSGPEFAEILKTKKRLPNRNAGLQLACLNEALDDPATRTAVATEVGRLLAQGSTLFVAGETPLSELDPVLAKAGFERQGTKRYASEVLRFDWYEIGVYVKLSPKK